ncbi:M1 family aminopeptidase [Pararcticibacter amylolyticus]|uniref:Aminopeptidase N n=1 Tax=Pararcticibacter amylolyticus TaxID=2173175 RepID=A0A2U2PI69_9SPHI|nr:M1 family aminopeptidase [Pararcticibacter amylolyticus]PWG81081.1 alanyl aminopeptidase [Pararcticibacter amylolyticus]
MRYLHQYCFFAATVLFLLSCSSTQKVVMDPITVSSVRPGANIYRGSYTRLTDIIHTKLDLKFDWDSSHVIGKAFIQAKPWFYPSDSLVLSAKGFKIEQVALVKKDDLLPLKYTYDRKKLKIILDKTYTRDQKYTVYIQYVAMPSKLKVGEDIASSGDRGFYFVNADGKEKDMPQEFWTQGETECNSAWFPTIDGPQEKMTQEISLTVPSRMVTLSNGILDFSSDNGDGTRTDTWRQELPHSTYLTMVAAGNFTVVKDKWRDKEVSYYMEPEYAPNARLIFGKTPEMIEFFSRKTGVDYPWEKYSQIVVRNFLGGAMENTTATVFFDRMNLTKEQYLDETYEDIVSHELFHHWFGDLVTAESWANLPLNESFATYGEYLWNEYKYGRDYADQFGWKDLQTYLGSVKAKDADVIRYNYADREQMFDAVSYQKGGRILHMLRKTVGDEAFFKALNLYLTRNAYKTAEINDLRMSFEEVTGQDLNWFFNQWFLASGHPVLKIDSKYDMATKKVSVTISQQQDLSKVPLYRLPLAIDIYKSGKAERKEIVLEKQVQTFSWPSETEPQLINVDAEKYLLAEKKETKSLSQYIFQYSHAPLFLDRLEALQGLEVFAGEQRARKTIVMALDDRSWELRLKALNFISKLPEGERPEVYDKLKSMAINDTRSYVRAEAISNLKKFFKDRNNADILMKSASDKAPSVQKALSEK